MLHITHNFKCITHLTLSFSLSLTPSTAMPYLSDMEKFAKKRGTYPLDYQGVCYIAYTHLNCIQVNGRSYEAEIREAREMLEEATLSGKSASVLKDLLKALTGSEEASSRYDVVQAILDVKTADAGFAAARKAGKIKIPDGVDTDLFYTMTMLQREFRMRAGWWYEVDLCYEDGTILFTSDHGYGEKALITLKKESDSDPFFKITVTLHERDEEYDSYDEYDSDAKDVNAEAVNYLSPPLPRCTHKAMAIRTGTPWDVCIAASDIMQVLVKCAMDDGNLKDHLTDDVVIPMF